MIDKSKKLERVPYKTTKQKLRDKQKQYFATKRSIEYKQAKELSERFRED